MVKKLTDAQEIELCEIYTSGKTIKESAALFNVSFSCGQRVLHRRGYHVRTDASRERKYGCNDYYFDNIDTEEKAYFFGLLYADGFVVTNSPMIKIHLQESDKYMIERLNDLVTPGRPLGKIKKKYDHWSDMYGLTITSIHIKEKLISYGMLPNKSLILEFPQIILDSDEDIIRHFLRGFFDGNGCCGVYYKKKHTSATLVVSIASTKEMCFSINDIIMHYIGVTSTVRKINTSHDRNSYEINITGGKIQIATMLDWLYKNATIYLDRKYESYLKIKEISNK